MTEKRFILTEQFSALQGVTFVKDECVDVDTYYTVDGAVDLLNDLWEENEQLKQQLKSIEDSFEFSFTENHVEFNKDEIKFKDTHTELTLKDGKLYLSVFIPKINEYFKFFHWLLEED